VTVLFLQEHWFSADLLSNFGNFDERFLYTGVSGFDNREVLSGRPYGVSAIL
jgi:hypothetical protein